MRRALVSLAVCAACGDSGVAEQQVDAESGTRTKLELFLYDDGTRQVDNQLFYDTHLHAECAPAQWIDGQQRCVPNVGDAEFADPACATPIGFWPTKVKQLPTHFIGYEQVDGDRVPAHLYPVRAKIASAAEYYSLSGGACNGPFGAPADTATYGLDGELAPESIQAVFDSEVGSGRLALQMKTTPDGMQVPWRVYDHELDTECTPTVRASGVVCEPDALDVDSFADPSCMMPAVVVTTGAPHPSYVRSLDAQGCARFAPLADPLTTVYAPSGTTCYPYTVGSGQQAFAVGPSVEAAALSREIENVAGHRMQQQIFGSIDDPTLRFVASRLYDMATRSECVLTMVGDKLRCVPVPLPFAVTLYGAGCALPVQVALVSADACVQSAFVASFSNTGDTTVHAIGDIVTDPLFHYTNLGCVQYTPDPGTSVHSIGPALSADLFSSALLYGAR